MVRRDTHAPSRRRRSDRRHRRGGGAHASVRRLSPCRGARPPTVGERQAGVDLRRQPPRPPSRAGQGRHRRRHARRPDHDAAPQHHRRAHLALSQRRRVLRPVRRARHVRRRRVEHREPRLQHEPLQRPSLAERMGGPRRTDGAARPQPSQHHPVEPGQRERLRHQPRRARRMDPQRGSEPTAALRGRGVPRWLGRGRLAGDRHRVPDVRHHRRHPRVRRVGGGHSTVDHVRVQPCDGQQQRVARRLLAGDHHHARSAGRLHLGVEGPRHPPGPGRRQRPTRLRRAVRRHAPRLQLRRRRTGRQLRGTPPGDA